MPFFMMMVDGPFQLVNYLFYNMQSYKETKYILIKINTFGI